MGESNMLWYEALILGIIQGLTEFIPVSSSGHLVVTPLLFGWDSQPLVFDLILHLGTATALIYYFRFDLLNIAKNLFSEIENEKKDANKYTYESQLGIFIIIGSIPAALLGYFLDDFIESTFRSIFSVAILLLLGSILMFYAEYRNSKIEFKSGVTARKSFFIGLFQSLALFPGFSRSGSTLSGGMLLGLDREYAARFSFLLSIPVILGAAILKIASASDVELMQVGLSAIVLGYFSSTVVGYMAIKFLLNFLKNHSLYIFVIYRILLAGILFLFSTGYLDLLI